MRVWLSLIFIFISVLVLSAQEKAHEVKLSPLNEKLNVTFYCDSIIDNRINKSNIGMVKKGLDNKNREAKLTGPFKVILKDHINEDLLFSFDNSDGLIFIFHEFNISEQTTTTSESATCRLEIEFAERKGSELYSYGTYHSNAKRGAIDATSKHSNLINECLINCIQEFIADGSTKQELQLVHIPEIDTVPFELSALPEVAYYDSFSRLRMNRPMEHFKAKLLIMNSGQEILHYKIKANEKKDRKKIITFLKYNGELYINSSSYATGKYLVKAKQVGRFIYFEDRYSNTGAAVAFGAIGAAVSNTKKSLVIDTHTGILNVVTPEMVPSFIENYPEIKRYWDNSKRKHEDIEEVFVKLNKVHGEL